MNSVHFFTIGMLVILSNSVEAEGRAKCTTPKNEDGFCVPMLQCKSLLDMLTTVREHPENREYLRRSRCGDISGGASKVQVCCPIEVLGNDPISQSNGLLPPLSICGLQNEDRLITGNVSKIDEFPWVVQLIYKDNASKQKSICAGTLINDEYVVTSAHCVDERNLQTSGLTLDSIRLGEFDTKKDTDCECAYKSCDCDCADPVVDIKVGEVIVHENYYDVGESKLNDIALVRLSKKLDKFTEFIVPICLADPHTQYHNNSKAVATGWGFSQKGFSSNTKLKRNIQINGNMTTCAEAYKTKGITIDPVKQICAGGADSNDTCYGEPGAPLLHREDASNNWRLAGIVSYGPKDCTSVGYPAVYTRVSEYTDWIVDKLIHGWTLSALKT